MFVLIVIHVSRWHELIVYMLCVSSLSSLMKDNTSQANLAVEIAY